MTAPLIGITLSRQTHKEGFPLFSSAEVYTQAVSQAGGIPLLIPLGLPESQLRDLMIRLDGILLSGGGDIDPARFEGIPHPKVDLVDLDRDRVEIELTQYAVQHGLPFLGICRGIQVINVALGGTLYTDIADQHPDALHHPHIEGNPRGHLAHDIDIREGTQLFEIIGKTKVQVNSLHHQAILKLAPGLVETARAADGIIEAVELIDHPFGIGVQWHPEWLTTHASMRKLFRSFVAAAQK